MQLSQSDLDAMLDGARQEARLSALQEAERVLEQRVAEQVGRDLATALERETSRLRAAQLEQMKTLASLLGEQVAAMQTRLHDDWASACEQVGLAILGSLWTQSEFWPAYVRMLCEEHGHFGPSQLRVHPQDLSLWRDAFSAAGHVALELIADHTVKSGGCLLQSRDGLLDIRHETQAVRWRDLAQRVRSDEAQP